MFGVGSTIAMSNLGFCVYLAVIGMKDCVWLFVES
jgi:hypothetical protein